MKIKTPQNSDDYNKIDAFFGKIWKEEFDLDVYNQVEKYEGSFVFFVEENEIIVSAINFFKKDEKWKIGRFATEKSYRSQGIGSKLLQSVFDFLKTKNAQEVFLNGEVKQIAFYEKFGFRKMGEEKEIGNTRSIEMKKEL